MVCRIITILLIILISSCSLSIQEYDWQLPVEISTKQEALNYVDTFQYEQHDGVFLPDEFFTKGFGDCEEFSLMLQYIFETELKIKADLIGGYINNTPHMWIESEGNIYEATTGMENNLSIYNPVYRIEYPLSIKIVETYGGFPKDVISKCLY